MSKKVYFSKPDFTSNDYKVMMKSLKSGWLTHGPKNLEFEKKFASIVKSNYAISMNSCTSALECAMKIIKRKGEVIIPSWTWVTTANVVLNTGNIPVFADVDINSRNITAEFIKRKISKKTVAVIVVHYGGLPCEMGNILKLCKKHNLELIEDSAETLGASWNRRYTGSFGLGCFSFFPTKNITTTEGGMLTTKNKSRYLEIKKLIAHGINKDKKKHFWHRESDLPGHNFRLPNHLAALGLSQLKRLNKLNNKRRKIAKIYDKFLSQFPKVFSVQKIKKNLTHSYQMYSFQCKAKYRNNLLYFLKKENIEASAHFDPPLHKQKYLKKFSYKLPNTELLAKEIITLPMHTHLKKKEIDKVTKIIKKWYNNHVKK